MSTFLKICGIRRPEDVQYLNEFSPDFAGFICSQPFWRYVEPAVFKELVSNLHGEIGRVGVFVNPTLSEIAQYAAYLDVIQLHGEETADFIADLRGYFPEIQIWKAARVQTAEDIARADALPVDKLVLDSFSAVSHGGTGEVAPWDLIVQNRTEKPFLLAGGITPENVTQAIAEVQPWGVDASSSLETDKCKEMLKIQKFVETVQNPLYCHSLEAQS